MWICYHVIKHELLQHEILHLNALSNYLTYIVFQIDKLKKSIDIPTNAQPGLLTWCFLLKSRLWCLGRQLISILLEKRTS